MPSLFLITAVRGDNTNTRSEMSLLPSCPYHDRAGSMVDREFFQPLNQLVPQDYFKPFGNVFRPLHRMLKEMDLLASSMNRLAVNEGANITSDGEKFQVNVDVQHFAPDEINVKVVDGFVTIECKHEERRDEHGYVSRQFVRRYALPQGCLPDTVMSRLSSDGVLTVTAPKVLPMPSSGERIVPIQQTGPVKKIMSNE